MKRKIERTRCSGQWTEAEFISFVKNQLRSATRKWRPIQEALRSARVAHGVYRCTGYDRDPHDVPVSIKIGRVRYKNVSVDHNPPVIDPEIGFTTWDDFINNLFCEGDKLQVLCKECHDAKSKAERNLATERRKIERGKI